MNRRNRGLTLVELIISVGVSSLLVASTAAVFIAVSKSKSASSKRAQSINSGAGTTSMLEFDSSNAGYHWPSLPFAVSVTNNWNGTAAQGQEECGSTTRTRVPFSDSVEFSWGTEASAGRVTAVTALSPVGKFSGTLASTAPFADIAGFTSGSRQVVIFASKGMACMAAIEQWDPTTRAFTATLMKRDYKMALTTDFGPATPPTWNKQAYFTGGMLCPSQGMEVYRLRERVKYVLCQDNTNADDRVIIKRRMVASTANNGGFTWFTGSDGKPGVARFASVTSPKPGPDETATPPQEIAKEGVYMLQIGVKIEYQRAYARQFGANGTYGLTFNGSYRQGVIDEGKPEACDLNSCWCNTLKVAGPARCPNRAPSGGGTPTWVTNLTGAALDAFQFQAAGNNEYQGGAGDLTFDGSRGPNNPGIDPPIYSAYRIDDASWPMALAFQVTHARKSDTNEVDVVKSFDHDFTPALGTTPAVGDDRYGKNLLKTTSTIRLMAGMVQ